MLRVFIRNDVLRFEWCQFSSICQLSLCGRLLASLSERLIGWLSFSGLFDFLVALLLWDVGRVRSVSFVEFVVAVLVCWDGMVGRLVCLVVLFLCRRSCW